MSKYSHTKCFCQLRGTSTLVHVLLWWFESSSKYKRSLNNEISPIKALFAKKKIMKYMVHFHQQTRNQVTVWKNSNSLIWDKFSWKRDQKLLCACKKFWKKFLNFNLPYLFVCACTSNSRIFHSHSMTLMAIKLWGFLACHT